MRRFAITAVLLTALPILAADVVRVGVFGLFHPQELIVRAADEPLTIRIANYTTLIVARGESARFGLNENGNDVSLFLRGAVVKGKAFEVSSASKLAANFTLTVPGKLRRQFSGVLLVERSQSDL